MSTKAVVLAIVFIFDKSNMIVCDEEVYEGTSFPRKYFLVETEVPTVDNLEAYLVNAKMVINAITAHPNRTDPNRALGVHLMKGKFSLTVCFSLLFSFCRSTAFFVITLYHSLN